VSAVKISWTAEGFWLCIEHDGNISWDEMQAIKNEWFGENVTCCEIYPCTKDLINNGNFRHIWRIPNMAEFC